MASDELEPGQDDLVKEGRAGSGIVRKVKHARHTGLSGKDDIYTDHKAGDPSQFTPAAERDRGVQKRSGSPIRATLRESVRNAGEVTAEVFRRLVASAKSLFKGK